MKFGTKDPVDGLRPCRKTALAHAKRMDEAFEVETLEGVMQGNAGDYLMQGVSGELYPCAAAIFDSSYEWAEDETSRPFREGDVVRLNSGGPLMTVTSHPDGSRAVSCRWSDGDSIARDRFHQETLTLEKAAS